MRRAVVLLVIAGRIATAQVTVPGPEGDCGFSRFQPIRISHYVETAAVAKVTPEYPPAAKANGTTGVARVRVLINIRGLVERTCPEYVKDQPRPDRSLVIAAESAALQWSFQPNFNLVQAGPLATHRFNYAQGVLVFKFVLDEPAKASP